MFDVDRLIVEAVLGYAGLGPGEARELVDEGVLCDASGRVNLGLLLLSVLERLVELGRGGGFSPAGVVEDVSRSRVLVSGLLAELIWSALPRGGGLTLVEKWALGLFELAQAGWLGFLEELRSAGVEPQDCFCGEDPEPVLEGLGEWRQLVSAVHRELSTRFAVVSPQGPGVLEAAVYSSGAVPDYGDSELVYGLAYTRPWGSGAWVVTAPRPRRGLGPWLARSLEEPRHRRLVSCRSLEDLQRRVERIVGSVRYVYLVPALPGEPPSCLELARRVRGLRPCDAAGLVSLPPAVRLEYVEGMRGWRELLAFLYYSSLVTLYGYPSQLLVVDKASRLHADEAAIVSELLEAMSKRLQPYTSFIRGWESRSALA
ncbi:hypothetical protein PABY_12370 [Pyrodictium abyssi]|uniref:NurA domain-containing protein n=1 Tax=Pyrodictium abyssi TaxID=54256 RepID=A0ABM8IVU6_9CREN|nr:hypothetical protein PABY_12370 [Pyrodictium abyssi]